MSITKQLPEITALTKIGKLPRHSDNVKFRISRKKFKCLSLHEIQLRHLQHKGILDVYAPFFIHPLKDTISGNKKSSLRKQQLPEKPSRASGHWRELPETL